ncbi:MAG: Calx-beta domain-containing protein, partial [Planctomycetota bacterium]
MLFPSTATLAALLATSAAAPPPAVPVVQFASSSSFASEGASSVSIQVTLSETAGVDVVIPYTVGGSADASDATIPSGPLVIPMGQTSGTIDVQIIDDIASEGRERFLLTLGSPSTGTLGALASHEFLLLDNEPAAAVRFALAAQTIDESAGTVGVEVTLSAARTEDSQVDLSVGGTATLGGVDAQILTASPVVLPGGVTTITVDVAITPDALDELDETVTLDISAPDNCILGTPNLHTLTIADDDAEPAIEFALANSTTVEFDAGIGIAVELSAPSALDVEVPVTLTGTATDGADLSWSPQVVTIDAGDTSAMISVTPVDDGAAEGSETATFVLGAPTNAVLGSLSTHDLLIIDDDGGPRLVEFTSPATSVEEGDVLVQMVVELDDYAPQPVLVPVSAAGTATPGVDFDLLTTTATIPVGELSALVEVAVLQDVESEPAETVDLLLGAPTGAALGGTTSHVLTIEDDDGPVTVSFAVAAQAAQEGAGPIVVDVVLSGPAPADVTIPLVVSGTAEGGGVDFDVAPDPLVIGTGASAGQFTVTPNADALFENDETVVLDLGVLTGADPGPIVQYVLTLENDDPLPVVEFEEFRSLVGEREGSVDVRIVLDVPSGLDVVAPFTASGDATVPDDVTLPASPVVIPAGDTFVDLTLGLVVDREPELLERLLLTLDAPTDATIGSTSTHLMSIIEGDAGLGRLPEAPVPSQAELTFETSRVGTSTTAQALFFTNMQTNPVVLENVTPVGEMMGDFALSFPVALPITLQPGQSAQVDVSFTPLSRGVRELELIAEVANQGGPSTPTRVVGTAFGFTGEEIAMTAAAAPLDGPGRTLWSADYGATGGSLASSDAMVGGTSLPDLYRTFRVGDSFDYAFELPNGAYEVVLYTWEPTQTAVGERVFDVEIEGATAIAGLDVFSEVGGAFAYETPPQRVDLVDGILDIGLRGVVAQAVVSAIEIRSIPVLSSPTTSLGYGIVEQGQSRTLDVRIANDGLHRGQIDRITFRTGIMGSSSDFQVEVGGVTYPGADITVFYSPIIELPPGMTTIPVTFTPTEHLDHLFVLDFESGATGDVFSIDIAATGGAEAGWGFLHPVPDSDPAFVVDYEQDGVEVVQLLGAESHTHEPGQFLAAYEWKVDGSTISTDVDTSHAFSTGSSTVTLTITDDNVPPNSATDDRTIVVHPVDAVPGPLCFYYDGKAAGEVFLLDNVPSTTDFVERLGGTVLAPKFGRVGSSPFSGQVMVQWVASFDLAGARTLEFVTTGGVERRVLVDGAPASGPIALAAGSHDLDLRFAVTEIANLPLTLEILEGGSSATDVVAALQHDERLLPPVIHSMPTTGSDLGGNRIEIDGFGFFPRASTVVHWGATDITSAEFEEWRGERIVLTSPPGSGSIQVTVETPNGVSEPIQFDYSPTGPVPVRFELLTAEEVTAFGATSAAWGPDGRLYVAQLNGKIRIVTYNDDYSVQQVIVRNGVSALTNRDTLALAFNPFDAYDPLDPSSIRVYLSHGEQFQNGGGSFSGPSFFTGQVSVVTGPNFNNPQALATGLPVSNHDHSVNGMVFDDNGDMLLCVGGNTNAGVTWPLIGDVPESPLSGAIVKLRLSDPSFNGIVEYVDSVTGVFVDDQVRGEEIDVVDGVDIDLFAAGFRNTYDVCLHTNGYFYATDNGPNNPYGPASIDASSEGTLPHPTTPDTLDLVEPGNYYGSANRSRGRYDDRENTFRSNLDASIPDEHVGPMALLDSSTNGLVEYRAATFNSEMRGELIAMKWNSGIYRIELDEDGRSVDSTTLYSSSNSAFPPNGGLDVVTGPGGAIIAIDYSSSRVRTQVPDDIAAVGLTPYDITPWRAPATGGQPFVIGGTGFGSQLAGVSVTIGGIPATLTSVSDTRIRGVLPPSPTGEDTELLDVNVQVRLSMRKLERAFRYMPPAPGMSRGTWRDASQLPAGLGDVVSAVADGRLFVFGAGDTRTFAFDPLNDTWSTLGAVRPHTGGGHAAEVVDGRIYLFGGFEGGAAGRVQIYDPVSDQWTLGAPMPWNAGGCATATIDGTIYVAGGVAPGGGSVANVAAYDPIANDWTPLGALPTAVHMAAAGTDGSRFFLFGGREGNLAPQSGIAEVQVYDPVAASWQTSSAAEVAPLPAPRSSTGRAVFWGDEFYVLGGADGMTTFDEVYAYEPASDSWREDRSMPTSRQAISPALFQGRIFVHGGASVVGFGTLT